MVAELEARDRILDAAARLFAAKGFAGTTVRDISTAAGLNLAMIHYYFGNKEGLYRAIFEEKVSEVRRIFAEAAAAGGTCRERIERIVRAYVHFLCAHPYMARMIQLEMLSGGPVLDEVFRPVAARNYSIMRSLVEDGVRAGEFRDVDVDLTPLTMVGMIVFFLIAQPIASGILGTGPGCDGFETRLADHTLNILFRGLLVPGDGPSPE